MMMPHYVGFPNVFRRRAPPPVAGSPATRTLLLGRCADAVNAVDAVDIRRPARRIGELQLCAGHALVADGGYSVA